MQSNDIIEENIVIENNNMNDDGDSPLDIYHDYIEEYIEQILNIKKKVELIDDVMKFNQEDWNNLYKRYDEIFTNNIIINDYEINYISDDDMEYESKFEFFLVLFGWYSMLLMLLYKLKDEKTQKIIDKYDSLIINYSPLLITILQEYTSTLITNAVDMHINIDLKDQSECSKLIYDKCYERFYTKISKIKNSNNNIPVEKYYPKDRTNMISFIHAINIIYVFCEVKNITSDPKISDNVITRLTEPTDTNDPNIITANNYLTNMKFKYKDGDNDFDYNSFFVYKYINKWEVANMSNFNNKATERFNNFAEGTKSFFNHKNKDYDYNFPYSYYAISTNNTLLSRLIFFFPTSFGVNDNPDLNNIFYLDTQNTESWQILKFVKNIIFCNDSAMKNFMICHLYINNTSFTAAHDINKDEPSCLIDNATKKINFYKFMSGNEIDNASCLTDFDAVNYYRLHMYLLYDFSAKPISMLFKGKNDYYQKLHKPFITLIVDMYNIINDHINTSLTINEIPTVYFFSNVTDNNDDSNVTLLCEFKYMHTKKVSNQQIDSSFEINIYTGVEINSNNKKSYKDDMFSKIANIKNFEKITYDQPNTISNGKLLFSFKQDDGIIQTSSSAKLSNILEDEDDTTLKNIIITHGNDIDKSIFKSYVRYFDFFDEKINITYSNLSIFTKRCSNLFNINWFMSFYLINAIIKKKKKYLHHIEQNT